MNLNKISEILKTREVKHYDIGVIPSMSDVKNIVSSREFEGTLVIGGLFTAITSGFTYLVTSDNLATTAACSISLLFIACGSFFIGRKEDTKYWLKPINNEEIIFENENTTIIEELKPSVPEPVKVIENKEKSLKKIGEKLTSTLAEYKYSAGGGKIATAVVGYSDEAPMVIIYDIIPVQEEFSGLDIDEYLKSGQKLYKILKKGSDLSVLNSLGDNLSRDLGLPKGLNITVDLNVGDGKAAIYLPKEKREWVYTKDYLDEIAHQKMKLPMFMGKGIDTNNVYVDLVDGPHCIIGGTTKSGKTVSILSILTGLAYSKSPKDVNFILIDPKRVGLQLLNDLPHVITPSITDMEMAMYALRDEVEEMNRRYTLMENLQVQDIEEYNTRVDEKLPYRVVVFEELSLGIKSKLPLHDEEGNELKRTVGQEIESLLVILTAAGRAAGIHGIFLTQRFSATVFDGEFRDNVDMGVCMRVPSTQASKMIIGETGGQHLLGYGDSLVKISGWNSAIRVQGGGFTNNSDEVKELVTLISKKWQSLDSENENPIPLIFSLIEG